MIHILVFELFTIIESLLKLFLDIKVKRERYKRMRRKTIKLQQHLAPVVGEDDDGVPEIPPRLSEASPLGAKVCGALGLVERRASRWVEGRCFT